ncbi:hypothetical protein CXG81DRAFT_8111, partial [Caulochytrium protostelioides]
MAFSGALILSDLNDFITPSQECIKPVAIKKRNRAADATGQDGGEPARAAHQPRTAIRVDDASNYYAMSETTGHEEKLEKAAITLNDCLACSGCVTSAESMLITLQSHHELYKVLDANADPATPAADRRVVVVSISPQTRASLAAAHGLSVQQVAEKLEQFFHVLGVAAVVDTAWMREISLRVAAQEFVQRYRALHPETNPTQLLSATSETVNVLPTSPPPKLPLLASACPGWICYAEKSHGALLPYISTTKSPQQVAGAYVKHYLARSLSPPGDPATRGVAPNQIYHVTIMPCYDKKLEASRPDFYDETFATRDVDCVLTTGECERMLRERGPHLPGMPVNDALYRSEHGRLLGSEGSTSGGYLSHIFRYAAATLFGILIEPGLLDDGDTLLQRPAPHPHVRFVPGRNADTAQWHLCRDAQDPNETPLLRFATAYGFRNLQSGVVIRRRGITQRTGTSIRPASSRRAGRAHAGDPADLHFIEVMACPSGCINGGGQLRAQP